MKINEMKVNEYLNLLKSDAPAPGGGSASALAGAQGIALFEMVCDLTIGKEKFAEYQEICAQAKADGEKLYKELTEAIDKDTEAFNLVSSAFKLPKATEEEKKVRSKAIAEGTLAATEVPFKSMELAYEGLLIVQKLVGKSNPNAVSDLGVAVLNLMSCIKGAWLNVKINLPGVKDEAAAKGFQEKGEKIILEAEALEKELYGRVLELL
ncbi:cyclodeaminase/cyclohydrolase family protein [Aminipila luticellarii]|uniref:Sugar ABC transporter substrate-binding protein n=1 Tax=Aminipila luticellarii TaxID=2507160 RepID=A0A410PSF3_9FIRM|nr:cyclodeaminase/cyclohydrolase family protein [Aminipila luticellarii]QAT41816.1 sugar ABC transporter substrate-binding protein [Aminipila luticellarii]